MAGMLQMRRSRGAFSGFLLVLLGLWGALTASASTASDLPLRTRADAVPAKHARNETTGDTTQTIG
jgi:hypothetical protein